jgi:hypothetical protein
LFFTATYLKNINEFIYVIFLKEPLTPNGNGTGSPRENGIDKKNNKDHNSLPPHRYIYANGKLNLN